MPAKRRGIVANSALPLALITRNPNIHSLTNLHAAIARLPTIAPAVTDAANGLSAWLR